MKRDPVVIFPIFLKYVLLFFDDTVDEECE